MRAMRLGVRLAGQRPLVSITAALTLAIGIGACAAVWTLLSAAVLHPFDVSAADDLVVVWEADPSRAQDLVEVSLPNFVEWQQETKSLSTMAAFGSSHWPVLARIGSETVSLSSRAVSETFFQTIGVRPMLGRDFVPSDRQPAQPPAVMLSHRLWRTRFAGAPSIVGTSIFVDGIDHVVIGVMPSGFTFPDDPDVWVSVERTLDKLFGRMPAESQRLVGILKVLGRRQAEVSMDRVRAELSAIAANVRRRHGQTATQVVAVVTPFSEVVLGGLGARLWIAIGLAGLVFGFACANVAMVRAAHAREREAELALRRVLGAPRARIVWDFALEAVPLVGVVFALAWLCWSALVLLLLQVSIVAQSGIAMNRYSGSALAVVAILSAVAWIVIGLLPAHAAVAVPQPGGMVSRVIRRSRRIGAPVLGAQTALALVVVAVTGAALQGFSRLSQVDVGFVASDRVILLDISIPRWKYPAPPDMRRLFEQTLASLREIPGVSHAAAVSVRPFRFGEVADGQPVRRVGDTSVSPDAAPGAHRVIVTPDYFAAVGQRIVEGRGFTDADRADTEPVVVVSQTLARMLFADAAAIGQRLETFTLAEKWRARTIVGVSADARYRGMERPSLELYMPLTQSPPAIGSFVLATHADVTVTRAMVRRAMDGVESEMAIDGMQTSGGLLRSVLAPARLLTVAVSALGVVIVVLLVLGIFGAAAVAVRAAWAEIGLRQAIGATWFQATHAPLRMLVRALGCGVLAGATLTPFALIVAAQFGVVASSGTLTAAAAALGVIVAAAAGVAPPLWRAARLAPATLLRE